MKRLIAPSLVVALGLVALAGDGPFAPRLPAFSLEDPTGKRHERDALLKEHEGLVMIVTTPTRDQGDEQQAWNAELEKAAPKGARWVLVEDMSQSWFQDTALERMKKEFSPEKPPLLLLDKEGALRKQLQVGEDKTVVLVYDRGGALRHSEVKEASPDLAKKVWAAHGADGESRSK